MKTRISNIAFNLILLAIFLLPLTISDNQVFLNFGEFRNETYIYPLLLAILIVSINISLKGKINVPYREILFQILMLFVFWCFISYIINFAEIQHLTAKSTSGNIRFLKQFSVLVFSLLLVPGFLLIILGSTTKPIYYKIYRYLSFSFNIVLLFGIIQICAVVYNLEWAIDFLNYVNNSIPLLFIRTEVSFERITSISHEPPFLAMFLILFLPWVLRNIVLEKSKYLDILRLLLIIILAYFSKSRTAQLILIIQLLFFAFMIIFYKKKFLLKLIRSGIVVFLLITIVFAIWHKQIIENFEKRVDAFKIAQNIDTNISDKTRLGTVIASLNIFKDSPIYGVGLGQQGYYLFDYYPKWAVKKNWEIASYKDESTKNFPPGYNLYTRLLAETGIIGFFIFIFFLFFLLHTCLNHYLKTKDINYLMFGVAFLGFSFNWLQIDSFRIFGFWLMFSLFILYKPSKKVFIE